jgi:hypothetical protein
VRSTKAFEKGLPTLWSIHLWRKIFLMPRIDLCKNSCFYIFYITISSQEVSRYIKSGFSKRSGSKHVCR